MRPGREQRAAAPPLAAARAWTLYAAGFAGALVIVADLMAAGGDYAELYRLQERAYR